MQHREHGDDDDEEDEETDHHMGGQMKKEFKLAMLEKKEKILTAKLEFIGKIKDLMNSKREEKKI